MITECGFWNQLKAYVNQSPIMLVLIITLYEYSMLKIKINKFGIVESGVKHHKPINTKSPGNFTQTTNP
jgi:hypothetical protein